jgi:hypothetical protein
MEAKRPPGTLNSLFHQFQGENNVTEKQQKAYTDFYDSARHNEILEPETTLLVHLAAAMAIGCYP